MSDVVDKWAELYNAPEHAEREQLKARVIELAKENVQLRDAVAAAAIERATFARQIVNLARPYMGEAGFQQFNAEALEIIGFEKAAAP